MRVLLLLTLSITIILAQNVGIGIANPARKLDINGTLRLRTLVPSSNPYGTNYSILVRESNGDVSGINFTGNASHVLRGDGTFGTISGGSDVDWYEVGTTTAPNNINDNIYTQGNVGIGTTSPTQRLHIAGNLRLDNAFMPGNNAGNWGQVLVSQGAGNAPVWMDRPITSKCFSAGSNNYLMKWTGSSSVCNSIVYDNGTQVSIGTTTPGANNKFHVQANATNPIAVAGWGLDQGVAGIATNANSVGVLGSSLATSGGTGVSGITTGNGSVGVTGIGGNNNATGGLFNGGTNRTGVIGHVSGTTPNYYVGSGGSFTGHLYGVFAQATQASTSARAVEAIFQPAGNYDAYGVYGATPNTNANWGYGVVGRGQFYGVYAFGRVGATGTKPFMIDHPLDPENKLLIHNAVESPEVLNIYRGTVKLDANGEAVVQLPEYFPAVNINFSYQLTPVGSFSPVYIKEEINPTTRTFKIAGGKPGQKICWYVYAERNDPVMQAHPEWKIVEMEKKPYQKGKYFSPEAYNQPEEKAVYYSPKPKTHPTIDIEALLNLNVKN